MWSLGSSPNVLLRQEDTQKFMDLIKMADGYGVAAIGTYDAAFLGGDAYIRGRRYNSYSRKDCNA